MKGTIINQTLDTAGGAVVAAIEATTEVGMDFAGASGEVLKGCDECHNAAWRKYHHIQVKRFTILSLTISLHE